MNAARTRRTRRITASLGAAALGAALIVAPSMAAIPPSTFDAQNGALATSGASLTDWEDLELDTNDPPSLENGEFDFKDDVPAGQTDDSFTQGTSENTEPPVPETGSVPPNKSDLKRFFIGVDTVTDTSTEPDSDKPFLYLGWQRVLNPRGTTNMDFEFNQSDTLSTNGITPVRLHGDVLVEYKLAKGGDTPQIFVYKWNDGVGAEDPDYPGCEGSANFPCWSDRKDVTSLGSAQGSVNTANITSTLLPAPGTSSPYTFGEAAIDLEGAGLFEDGSCTTFGSAYLKSRSSDSFTAALKDYIAPMPIDLSNCGQFTIVKQTVDNAAGDFDFAVSPAAGSAEADGTGGAVSSATLSDADTVSDNESSVTAYNVTPGTYDVTETIPAGWNLDGVVCSDDGTTGDATTTFAGGVEIGISADSNVTCTFTNSEERGSILVEKVLANTTTRIAGASFAIDADGVVTDPNNDLTDIPVVAGVDGLYCIDDLLFGDYTVVETSPPAGYEDAAGTQDATVDTESTCADRATGPVDLTFANRKIPTLVTQAVTPVTVGDQVTDTATLSGTLNNATGTITFELFTDDECTQKIASYDPDPIPVAGDDSYVSPAYTTTSTATLYWKATYSGDLSNTGASHACAAEGEVTTVNKISPTLVTSATQSVTVGEDVTDTATLTGGLNPTGSITFELFTDDECTQKIASYASSRDLEPNVTQYISDAYTTTSTATLYWKATYSGDDNNNTATHECGVAEEVTTVDKASPVVVTTPKLLPNDSAALSGGFGTLAGNISFLLHDTADCSGTAIYGSGPITVSGAGTYKTNNTDVFITEDGTYSWYVSYSGDGNNNAAFSYCDKEQQEINFTPLGDFPPQQVTGP